MRGWVWLGAAGAVALAGAAAAQADGSLAEAYAAQCPNDEQTTACKVLRDAIARAAAPKGKRPAAKGKPRRAVAKAMTPPPTPPRIAERILDVQGEITKANPKKNGVRYAAHLIAPRADRVYRIRVESEQLVDASVCTDQQGWQGCYWQTDSGAVSDLDIRATGEVQPGTPLYVVVRAKDDKGRYRLTIDEEPVTPMWERDWKARRFLLEDLPGKVFRHPSGTLISFTQTTNGIEAKTSDETGLTHRIAPMGAFEAGQRVGWFAYGATIFDGASAKVVNLYKLKVITRPSADTIALVYDWGWGDVYHILPNGDLRVTMYRVFRPYARYDFARLSPADGAQALARHQQANANRRAAAASRGGGNSGLFGALAMATGAAIAGGNAEMVMGAAMKGAELTTNNEMTRNVLAGQGDAMMLAGADRMAAENRRRAEAQAAAARARQPVRSVEPSPGARPASAPPTVARAPQPQPRATMAAGGAGRVHLYCYQWTETPQGKRTSHVSQVGGVAKTATNPEMEAQTVQRWHAFLRSQGIEVSRTTGCRLDTDAAYNAEIRESFIGTALSEGTLRQLSWSPAQ